MGRIKHTEVAINDIVGEVASDSWYECLDMIENMKDEARENAYAQVEEYLNDHDIDVDDWEAVMDQSLEDYIDEYIYAEWEV